MEGCRPAEARDLQRIVQLARQLRSEIPALRGGTLWAVHQARPEPLEDAYERLLTSEAACVLVGTIDDVVVGFAVGELDRLHDQTLLGVMSDLYVEPPARGIGVGEALAERLLIWFREQGTIGADAWALPGDRATKNFFEGQGFTSRALLMHRRLEPPDAP